MSEPNPHSSHKKKAVSAVMWSGAENVMRQGIQFVVAVILARILSPEEFGTVALLYLFTGIAGVFIDSGFSSALVQQKDITQTDESTVFWFNLAMSIFTAGLLWLSAPWIAAFFSVPVLNPLSKVVAFSLVLNALGSVQMTLFTKRLDFKTLMKIGVLTTIISGTVAISLAMHNYGIWALAIQTVTASFSSTVLLWAFSTWRPTLELSAQSLRRLFTFGGYLMISSLLDVAYNRAYSLLIGKFYGIRDLAFYTRADNTKQIPVDLLSNTLSRVAFPIFSAAAHDKEKLLRGVKLALRGMMLINVPMMLGLMVTAENVIQVIFGAKWLPVTPILQVLCLAGVFWPLHIINLNVLKALGHSNIFFRLEVIKKVIGTIFIAFGATYYGVMGVAWSQVAFGMVGFVINSHYTEKFLKYGVLRQVMDFIAILLASVIMASLVYLVGLYASIPVTIELIFQIIIGVISFATIITLFKFQSYTDLKQLIKMKN